MRSSPTEPAVPSEPAVDVELARLGVCGSIDGPTQRRCFLPSGHSGGCHFLHVSEHPRLIPPRRRPPDPYP